jgi:hypothetical protein
MIDVLVDMEATATEDALRVYRPLKSLCVCIELHAAATVLLSTILSCERAKQSSVKRLLERKNNPESSTCLQHSIYSIQTKRKKLRQKRRFFIKKSKFMAEFTI